LRLAAAVAVAKGQVFFIVPTGTGSRGSGGRKSAGVPVGAAFLPPTHVGSYRKGSDCRLGHGGKMRPRPTIHRVAACDAAASTRTLSA